MFVYFNITNGVMDQEFKSDITTYYVDVDENTTELEFDFEMEFDTSINVVGNHNFSSGINYVFIELVKNDVLTTYTFVVNREESVESMMGYNNDLTKLEVAPAYSVPYDVTPLIVIVSFLLITISFKILIIGNKKKPIKKA